MSATTPLPLSSASPLPGAVSWWAITTTASRELPSLIATTFTPRSAATRMRPGHCPTVRSPTGSSSASAPWKATCTSPGRSLGTTNRAEFAPHRLRLTGALASRTRRQPTSPLAGRRSGDDTDDQTVEVGAGQRDQPVLPAAGAVGADVVRSTEGRRGRSSPDCRRLSTCSSLARGRHGMSASRGRRPTTSMSSWSEPRGSG